ncbi:MAG: hypothetical protein DCF22_17510 [Leptolyngbya sp.]|nr:MAG: hypothetical protein DCF22_17510 [Leptolyngbya sp.]
MPSAVLGSGPIGFTDTNGKQQSIPLSLLYFDNGLVKADKWPLYPANTAVVDALLKSLVAGEFLKPAPAPPPKPAMVLKAAIPGTRGNTIQVTFSNIVAGATPPTSTTFEAEITAKATYAALSLDPDSPSFIGKVLGVEAPGTSPGLVQVKKPAPAKTTPTPLPKVITTSKPLAGGGASAKSSLSVDSDPSGTAFTLEAWKDGVEGDNIKITIPDVNSGTKTFTLVVEWTQAKITSITLANLPSKLQGKKFVIEEVLKPEGAADFGIPALGTIVLNGGADATGALPAGAVAFSS